MHLGVAGLPYTGQGISSFSTLPQIYTQPLQQIAQSLQYVPYQLQQLQQVQYLQHQQIQQLLQAVPVQLQQIQQALQVLAQQIPSLHQQSFGQAPWASLSQTGAGYGIPFQSTGFGAQFGQGQVM